MKKTNKNMDNENLEGFEQRRDYGLMSPGMLVVVIIFFLTVISWGGLFYYSKDLTSRIEELKTKNTDYIGKDIMTKEAQKVADFQLRLGKAQELLLDGENLRANFGAIENSMLPVVYLNSYEFDDKEGTVTLECSTDNFNSVALQTLSFKKNSMFADVIMNDAYVDESGNRVRFNITIKLR